MVIKIDLETNRQDQEQNDALNTIDTSLGFLLLIITAVLLSFYSVIIQRQQLLLTQEGDTEALETLPDVFPIKLVAGAIVVGALAFFLKLAEQNAERASLSCDVTAKRSGVMNLWAALFVLAAAIIRFYDINYVRCNQPALVEEDTAPD